MVMTVDQVETILLRDYILTGTYNINPDNLVVDVDGGVSMKSYKKHFEIQFGIVTGGFNCRDNQLTSLKGAPHHVGGEFNCSANKLTSLVNGPAHAGSYSCTAQQLTSLEGAPITISGALFCSGNLITSLAHVPTGTTFLECQVNPLKNMDHLPPDLESISCSWRQDLPLLRLLMCKFIHLGWECPWEVNKIMTMYKGKGKTGAIRAAAELIRAGFKENARW